MRCCTLKLVERQTSRNGIANSTVHHCGQPKLLPRSTHLVRVAEAQSPIPDPFAEKRQYQDNFIDSLFIRIYSQKMAEQLEGVKVPTTATYDDFVRISKEIMKGRSPEEQLKVVNKVLSSLLPPGAPQQFRRLFPPTQWSAEFNAWIAAVGFYWLVGPAKLETGDVEVAPGVTRKQKSIVAIEKCRYLEASGCVGMCVNMCKVPTQNFFTQDLGLPLTMNPNFEDLSCKMIFGQTPPAVLDDDVAKQPCFVPQCSLAAPKNEPQACSKLEIPKMRQVVS